MPAPADVQTATLNKFLAAWETNDIEATVALWSDDFTQQLLPLSLGIPENSRAKAEIAYPRLMKNLTNWKVGTLLPSPTLEQIAYPVALGRG